MKKIIILMGLLISMNSMFAQNNTSALTLTPVVFYENSSEREISPQIRKQLEKKLLNIVVKNGMGSTDIKDRHIIFPDVQIVTKDVVPSVPPQVSMTLEISYYIADFDEKRIFTSESFEYRGVGGNDTKAMINAIRRVRPNDAMNAFIQEGKEAIINYYEENCDQIVNEAKIMVQTGREKEALYALTRVPKECSTCWEKVSQAIIPIYVEYENKLCEKNLAMAQSIWNSSQSYDGALMTQPYFSRILPGMDCYDEAVAVMKDMKTTLKVKDMREWEFKMSFAEKRAEMLEWIFNKYYELELAKTRNYNSWYR